MQPRWAILAVSACVMEDLDGDGVPATRDCNDGDPGQLLPYELYVDADGDGFGGLTTEVGCSGSAWLVESADDCDDLDIAVFPGAREIGCDGRDNDCNPVTVDGPAYTVGATWARVQDALDRVGYQETVHLCGSTIHESVTAWRPATVVGEGSGRTILSGSASGRSTIEARAALTLIGLTVSGGSGSTGPDLGETRYGGGIVAFGVESLTLQDVRITGNEADVGGGLAVVGDTTVTGISVWIDGNRADSGGGLYVGGTLPIVLQASAVVGNLADEGGGAWLDGTVDGEDLRITQNRARRGGGVHLQPDAVLAGLGVEISDNSALDTGGGVHGAGTVRDAVIGENAALFGGGLYASGRMRLEGVTVSGNVASDDGGGLGVAFGGAMSVVGGSLVDNIAHRRGGGGHATLGVLELTDVRIEGNIADLGGGLSCDRCTLDGTGIELRAGAATDLGGGLYTSCGAVRLVDPVIADNAAPDGAAVRADGGLVVLTRALSEGNTPVVPGATLGLGVGAGCESGMLIVQEIAADAGDLVGVGASPAVPFPGETFTCVASDKGDSCVVP